MLRKPFQPQGQGQKSFPTAAQMNYLKKAVQRPPVPKNSYERFAWGVLHAEPRPYLRHPACWRARNKANGPSRQISESLPSHFLSSRWGSVGRASYHLQNSASSSKFRPPTILPTIWSSAMPSCSLSRAPSASRPHPRLFLGPCQKSDQSFCSRPLSPLPQMPPGRCREAPISLQILTCSRELRSGAASPADLFQKSQREFIDRSGPPR